VNCEAKDNGDCPQVASWEWTLDTSDYVPLIGPVETDLLPKKLHFCNACHERRAGYQGSSWTFLPIGNE
jgi:hypothetical protein